MPAVSIVIPAYNCQDFIAAAVESALGQSYKDSEIIVVNDGSVDNTENVLQAFKDRIKVIYQPNGGPASARNTGILNAKGEYIAFLDQDDVWFPEKIETQMDLFRRNDNLGLVCSDAYIIDGKLFNKNNCSKLRYFMSSPPYRGDVFVKLFSKNFIMTSTVVVRKSCFGKIGLFDPALIPAEDYDRWLRLSLFYKVDFVDKPLIKYRDHVATFRKDPIRALTNAIVTYNKITRDYPESKTSLGGTFCRTVSKFYVVLGKRYLFRGNFKDALRNFSLSVKMTRSIFTVFYIILSSMLDIAILCAGAIKRSLCKIIIRK